MMSIEHIANQHIIDSLREGYGITVTALTHIPLGADMDAAVYRAQASTGLSYWCSKAHYFIKLKRGYGHEIGVALQMLLHGAGIPQIIAPIKTKDGQLTNHIGDYTLTVYPFIVGQDGLSRDLTDTQWITLGRALRQIHACAFPPCIKDQIKRESYSSQWCDTVRLLYDHIDTAPRITNEIALEFVAFMKVQREAIWRLIERAEQLRETIQRQSPEFVLCHSDIHGGNVLIADDGTLYIVDWDQPIMAPKERDLMFIGGGVANVWNKPHEEALFYQGYGNVEVNRDILAYYRYERIIQDIAEYGKALLLTTDSGQNLAEIYQQFRDMFEPNGVVEIACKTDEDI